MHSGFHLMRFVLTAVLVANCALRPISTWALDASSFEAKPAEWIEKKRREAVDLYHLKQYREANDGFFEILASDPSAPTASYAVDFLKRIATESGALKTAIGQYDELKKKGEVADVRWNPERAAVLHRLNVPGKLEQFLFSSLKLGGVVAAQLSLFGFLANNMGLTEHADYFVDRSDELTERAQQRAYLATRDRLSVRPMHFRWPSTYSDLRVPQHAPAQLQTVPFEPMRAGDETAVLLQKEVGAITSLGLGVFTRYDSNVFEHSSGAQLPSGVTREKGMSMLYFFDVAVQTDPKQDVNYGGEYIIFLDRHSRQDLSNYDTTSHVPSVWVSWWNKRTDEVRVRYDYAIVQHREEVPGLFHHSHGPQFGWSHLWNDRYQTSASYSIRKNTNRYDVGTGSNLRGGWQHEIALDGAFVGPGGSNRAQPFIGYSWERDLARGGLHNRLSHRFRVGTAYLLGETSTAELSSGYEMAAYPFHSLSREDTIKRIRAGLGFQVVPRMVSLMIGGAYVSRSSNISAFEYDQFVIDGGVVGTLSF